MMAKDVGKVICKGIIMTICVIAVGVGLCIPLVDWGTDPSQTQMEIFQEYWWLWSIAVICAIMATMVSSWDTDKPRDYR